MSPDFGVDFAMPIEIRELVIRAVVEPELSRGRRAVTSIELERLKREITAECIERIQELRTARTHR